jgi:sugar/nucleoside kinase (ribokinase family)
VVDTVGAGDTVGAILVEGIIKHSVNGLQGQVLNAVYIAQRLLQELPFHVLVLNLHDCTN